VVQSGQTTSAPNVSLANVAAGVLPGVMAYVRYGSPTGRQVFVDLADGTQSVQVTRSVVTDFRWPSWSADGTKLVVAWGGSGTHDSTMYDLYVMDANGANRRRIRAGVGSEYAPSLSPDGAKVAYYALRNGTWSVYVSSAADSATGTETRIFDFGATGFYSIDPYSADPYGHTRLRTGWSPDGRRLAFTGSAGGSYGSTSWALALSNADGTSLTVVPFTGLDRAYQPVWSPDGAKLAFTGDSAGVAAIYVVPVDTLSNRRRLAAGSWPMWSPTGQAIAYRCPDVSNLGLCVVGVTGSSPAPTRYRGFENAAEPSWAPVVRTLPTPAPTGQVIGRVVDAATQTSLSGVRVSYVPRGRIVTATWANYTTTDGNGNYTLTNVEPDTLTLTFSKDGYTGDSITVVVQSGQTTSAPNVSLRRVVASPPERGSETRGTAGRSASLREWMPGIQVLDWAMDRHYSKPLRTRSP
jgi:Tol biopolymer transport system component